MSHILRSSTRLCFKDAVRTGSAEVITTAVAIRVAVLQAYRVRELAQGPNDNLCVVCRSRDLSDVLRIYGRGNAWVSDRDLQRI